MGLDGIEPEAGERPAAILTAVERHVQWFPAGCWFVTYFSGRPVVAPPLIESLLAS
jgi:hypothetical protein